VRRYLLILVALVVALGGVAVLAVMRQPTLGLDLQGGLEVVLEARPEQGRELTQEDLDRAKEIIEERVNKTGVSEPEIRKQGANQISVSLPGVHDTARAARLIGQTATLEFYNLQGDALSPTLGAQGQIVASPRLLPLLSGQQELAKKGTPTAWYLYGAKKERLAGPADTRQEILQQLPGGEAPEGSKFYAVPEGRTILTCNENARLCPGVGVPNQEYYYLFKYQPNNAEETIPELTGEDLNGSGTRVDFQNNQPIVTLDFTNAGGDKFHEITRELAQRGRAQANLNPGVPEENFNQSFAIVLDGEIRSSRRSTSTTCRTGSRAARRSSKVSTTSRKPRTSRSSSRRARCLSSSSRSNGATSRPRSARTRSARRSSPGSPGSSRSPSSCWSSTASSAWSRSSASRSTERSCTARF
jgi:SecD/SecF fusion protein